MKSKILLLISIILMACSESTIVEPQVDNEYYKYESLVSRNRVNVAKALSNSLRDNSSLMDAIKEECNLKFDGDRNVLLRSLSNKNIVEFSIYDETAVTRTSVGLDEILESDSLLQVYYYQGNNSDEVQGIVVIPDDVQESEDIDLMAIDMNGDIEYISSQVDPDQNYFVISANERSSSYALIGPDVDIPVVSKEMSIIGARFISMEALRMAEGWWGGEPEMRIDVVHPCYYEATNTFEAHVTTYKYVDEGWISYSFATATYTATWNTTEMSFSTWDPDTEPIGRQLIFTEEDDGSVNLTGNMGISYMGVTFGLTYSYVGTSGDYLCFQERIYYDAESGIYNAGIMDYNLLMIDNEIPIVSL
ncbi:MAG: hypothetical protein R3Y59_10600 [bacterium]